MLRISVKINKQGQIKGFEDPTHFFKLVEQKNADFLPFFVLYAPFSNFDYISTFVDPFYLVFCLVCQTLWLFLPLHTNTLIVKDISELDVKFV